MLEVFQRNQEEQDQLAKVFWLLWMYTLAGTPAPGSYRLPSEFGYYESRNKANRSAGDMGETKP